MLEFDIILSNGLSAQRRSAFLKSGFCMDPADVQSSFVSVRIFTGNYNGEKKTTCVGG